VETVSFSERLLDGKSLKDECYHLVLLECPERGHGLRVRCGLRTVGEKGSMWASMDMAAGQR
jgi:hypothetical protein